MRLRPPHTLFATVRDLVSWCRQAVEVESYTLATLPDATQKVTFIYVTDATGGGIPCFNDGANWRRFDTRAIVS